jgi:hypothetical protein
MSKVCRMVNLMVRCVYILRLGCFGKGEIIDDKGGSSVDLLAGWARLSGGMTKAAVDLPHLRKFLNIWKRLLKRLLGICGTFYRFGKRLGRGGRGPSLSLRLRSARCQLVA